jgi:hypothetical protein
MPLLRSRLAQGGLHRHLCPTLPYTPKKIQEEQSVNDVGEPRVGVVAASMLPPCRSFRARTYNWASQSPTRTGRGRTGRAIRLHALGPPAAAGSSPSLQIEGSSASSLQKRGSRWGSKRVEGSSASSLQIEGQPMWE